MRTDTPADSLGPHGEVFGAGYPLTRENKNHRSWYCITLSSEFSASDHMRPYPTFRSLHVTLNARPSRLLRSPILVSSHLFSVILAGVSLVLRCFSPILAISRYFSLIVLK